MRKRAGSHLHQAPVMDLISHITLLGGACSTAELTRLCSRADIERALNAGVLNRVARGRYALASASRAVRTAAAHSGTLSMRSAAQQHGWGQRKEPRIPDVTFPRNRRVERTARRVLVPHWSDLPDADVENGTTTKRRTLIDCMRNLPLADSVPIVDSAVRAGDITTRELRRMAAAMKGRGRARAMAVAAMASSKPANAFESSLRAIASTIPGLRVEPQRTLRIASERDLRPDFIDERLGIVIEAESFEWHGDRRALSRDCTRYNILSTAGWIVVRFSWEQVILAPAYVVEVLVRAVRLARQHANVAAGAIQRSA